MIIILLSYDHISLGHQLLTLVGRGSTKWSSSIIPYVGNFDPLRLEPPQPGQVKLPPVARKNGKTKSETYAFSVNFGRTDLLIGQSKAKNCEESAGDVRIGVAPQKPSKNMEKRAKFCDKKIFDVEKRNVGNRPKRIFAKFRGDRR